MSEKDRKRIESTLTYLEKTLIDKKGFEKLENWVYEDLTWTPISLGRAITMDDLAYYHPGVKYEFGKETLIQACLLLRIAAENPVNLSMATKWRYEYLYMKEMTIKQLLAKLLNIFMSRIDNSQLLESNGEKKKKRPSWQGENGLLSEFLLEEIKDKLYFDLKEYLRKKGGILDKKEHDKTLVKENKILIKNMIESMTTRLSFRPARSVDLTQYGIYTEDKRKTETKEGMKEFMSQFHLQSNSGGFNNSSSPTGRMSVKQLRMKYEYLSRSNIILSGHGVWLPDYKTGDWPVFELSNNQIIYFYCQHGSVVQQGGLGNAIDGRQYAIPTEVRMGPTTLWNYHLFPQGDLGLGNNGKNDSQFITVREGTRLSKLLKKYPNSNIHWSACREVADTYDKILKWYKKLPGKSNPMQSKNRTFDFKGIRWNEYNHYWEYFYSFGKLSGWIELPASPFLDTYFDAYKGIKNVVPQYKEGKSVTR